MARNFEELEMWQVAKELSIHIYKIFKNCKDFRFRDQIQSAAVSVMNNIAEGFERKKSSKEFERFLYIAKGSSAEVRSMLYLALEFKYINPEEYEKSRELCMNASKKIYYFLSSLHSSAL